MLTDAAAIAVRAAVAPPPVLTEAVITAVLAVAALPPVLAEIAVLHRTCLHGMHPETDWHCRKPPQAFAL